MGWFDILKVIVGADEFLRRLAETLGGGDIVKNTRSRLKEQTLHGDWGYVKIKHDRKGQYWVGINIGTTINESRSEIFNLEQLLFEIQDRLQGEEE